MLKISVVSYLNSKPFIYGFNKTNFSTRAKIELDIPSVCADKLINGQVDIGLVPVAILPKLKNYHIISNYCIGANGPVDSVLLLSEVPLIEIKKIVLDYQSRTSVMLTRVLAKKFWQIDPEFVDSEPGYENSIQGNNAAIVIGDRALLLKNKFKYCYDLSGEWKKFTGLPFVFATWTASTQPSKKFLDDFNEAIGVGMNLIDEIAKAESNQFLSEELIHSYLTKSIDFVFDEKKEEALKLFLQYSTEI